ncbi:MAG TPA: hypothetical protein VNX68_07295, partial [Nitrosopumilaceae archaeon]|nr:hypothetical protein [Nitrosopumilaceae archaeon]
LSYKYEKIPSQINYKPPTSEKKKEKKTPQNGQLVIDTDNENRFMNAKITSSTLVPSLYAKYKTDIYLFINQLDVISSNAIVTDFGNLNSRTITIHYTVFTADAKEINSGIATTKFPANLNNPSKIISVYISKIAEELTRRIEKAAYPKSKLK